jgi:hypothetical protein
VAHGLLGKVALQGVPEWGKVEKMPPPGKAPEIFA